MFTQNKISPFFQDSFYFKTKMLLFIIKKILILVLTL